MKEIKSAFVNYFNFKGTATRKEFNVFWLFEVALVIILGVSCGFLGVDDEIIEAISFLLWLFLVIPWLSIVFRRLHDVGHSGWFILLFLIPIINFIFFLCLVFIPGKTNNNKYRSTNEASSLSTKNQI